MSPRTLHLPLPDSHAHLHLYSRPSPLLDASHHTEPISRSQNPSLPPILFLHLCPHLSSLLDAPPSPLHLSSLTAPHLSPSSPSRSTTHTHLPLSRFLSRLPSSISLLNAQQHVRLHPPRGHSSPSHRRTPPPPHQHPSSSSATSPLHTAPPRPPPSLPGDDQGKIGDIYTAVSGDGTRSSFTKLDVAIETGIQEAIVVDLVALNVNNIIIFGAKPLYFRHRISTSLLGGGLAEKVVKGIVDGCKQSDCDFNGEMDSGDSCFERKYGLDGVAIGKVGKYFVIDGANIVAGDVLTGLPSSGVHCGRFSLVGRSW